MNYNYENMTEWELQKSHFLINCAIELGIKLKSYGEISVNQYSGYTYLWSEDHPFSLYMPISCKLDKDNVYVLWTNSDNGEEIENSLSEFQDLDEIYKWVESLEEKYLNI